MAYFKSVILISYKTVIKVKAAIIFKMGGAWNVLEERDIGGTETKKGEIT